MKVIGVIPARFGSTRYPGKTLALLQGKPLILHVLDWVREAKSLDAVRVATDHEKIREVAESAGVEVRLTTEACRTGSDRVAEAVRGEDWDIVVNIQADEVKADPSIVDAIVQALAEAPECGAATAMVALRTRDAYLSPHNVKALVDTRGRAITFSRSPVPSPDRLTPEEMMAPDFVWGMKHLGLYAYRAATLQQFAQWPQTPYELRERLEQLRLVEHGVPIRLIEVQHDSIGVDVPEELAQLEAALSSISPGRKDPHP